MITAHNACRSGKTLETIRWSAETGGTILCATKADAQRLVALAKREGLKIPKPLVAHSRHK